MRSIASNCTNPHNTQPSAFLAGSRFTGASHELLSYVNEITLVSVRQGQGATGIFANQDQGVNGMPCAIGNGKQALLKVESYGLLRVMAVGRTYLKNRVRDDDDRIR